MEREGCNVCGALRVIDYGIGASACAGAFYLVADSNTTFIAISL